MSAPVRESDRERTVAVLAAAFHAPVDTVAALYEREQAALARVARVTTYVHIFALRQVEEVLRRRDRETGRDELDARAGPVPLSVG